MAVQGIETRINSHLLFGWHEGSSAAEFRRISHNLVDQALIFKGRNPVQEYGDLNNPNSPYSFNLNLERYVELLTDVLGLTPEEIGKVNIYVVGEGRVNLPRSIRERVLPEGKKRVIGREIRVGYTGLYEDEAAPPTPWNKRPIDASIYLFAFWHFFTTERRMILKYVKKPSEKVHQRLLGKHMRVFTITPEMLSFIASDPELADERLRKLAGIKLRDEVLEVTAHEVAAHLWDTNKDNIDEEQEMRKKLIARLFGTPYKKPDIMSILRNNPVFQRFLPNFPKSKPKILVFEDLAKAIQVAVREDPKWRDLIEFEINPNWPFNKEQKGEQVVFTAQPT